jgi:hypothetical protein
MRTRTLNWSLAITIALIAWAECPAQNQSQWQADPSGNQFLLPGPPLYSANPRTVTIGNGGVGASALNVFGQQMTPSTGEVFRTNADEHLDSYWRMFHGEDEFGQLFHLVDEKQFNINAPLGHLLFRTNDEWRMRINPTLNYSTLGSFSSIPADGFVGISPTKDFWANGPGPFSRLHLAEPGSINAQAIGYRPWQRNPSTGSGLAPSPSRATATRPISGRSTRATTIRTL